MRWRYRGEGEEKKESWEMRRGRGGQKVICEREEEEDVMNRKGRKRNERGDKKEIERRRKRERGRKEEKIRGKRGR